MPCGIFISNDDGTILFVNDELVNALHTEKNALENLPLAKIFPVSTQVFYQTHVFPVLKLKGTIGEVFVSLRTKDQKQLPVLLYAKRHLLTDTPLNLFVVLPVWQRKQYEEQLLTEKLSAEKLNEDNKELRRVTEELKIKTEVLDRQILKLTQFNEEYLELNKVIAHDFQEPIRKISLFVDMIKKTTVLDEAAASKFNKISNSASRLRDLTQSLDKFISVDTTSEPKRKLDLVQIITSANENIADELNFDDFDCEVAPMPDLDGYPSLLKQLFKELIKNAIQYRNPGRRLHISISAIVAKYNLYRVNDINYSYIDFVKITFADNGSGFDPQYVDYVFKMYKRLHAEVEGLGFGLSLCKKIVDKHLGVVTAESIKGIGTTIHIRLPVSMA
jgi:sigma-B regulation protein RsbU (phosphoserine phosphatase)